MKSYHLYCLFIFLALQCLISCNDDSTDEIILEQNDVTIWIGQEATIGIISEIGSLSIISEDETIASAIIKDNKVIVKANKKSGKTTLHLKNNSTKYTTTLIVYVQTLSGGWKETEKTGHQYEVFIEAEDEEIAKQLKQDLWESAVKLLGTTYGFYSDSQRLEVITRNGERAYGTFLFENEELTMSYNDNSEQYKVTLLGLRFIGLTQDLTDIYKNEYPDAGINKVLIKRYLSYISF